MTLLYNQMKKCSRNRDVKRQENFKINYKLQQCNSLCDELTNRILKGKVLNNKLVEKYFKLVNLANSERNIDKQIDYLNKASYIYEQI